MPSILDGIKTDTGCQLTAGSATHQPSVVVSSPDAPHLGPDFRGPFDTPEPGPNPTIEVKQEWTAMKVDVKRDLLADVVAAILDSIASFNPQTASGAAQVLDAIIAFKDRLINLIEPGTWSIKQDWSFGFTAAGTHACVVHPSIVATAWKNDLYFRWDISVETKLNGGSAKGEGKSKAGDRGLKSVDLTPDPAFAAPTQDGTNTVEQAIIVNVHFVGYKREFQDALTALDRAISWLQTKIDEILDWFSTLIDSIMGDNTTTQAEKDEAEARAVAERQRREAAAAQRAASMANGAKPPARSAIDRLRAHRAYFDLDYCRTRVICTSGTVEENQTLISENLRKCYELEQQKDLGALLEEGMEFPVFSPGELATIENAESVNELVAWSKREAYRHKLDVRKAIFERYFVDKDRSTAK